jgi:hypothetical protein
MTRILSILLIPLFLFNTFGNYFVFTYNRFVLRNEMNNLIKSRHFDKECTVIKIAYAKRNGDFTRVNDNEFRFKGVLYDIISEDLQDGILTIRCINDRQEDNLINGFSRSQELANDLASPFTSKHAAALRYHIITHALIESALSQPVQYPKAIKFQNLPCSFYFIINQPPAPPPKIT